MASSSHVVQQDLVLRRATPADAELIFAWRNTPEILSHGRTRRTVTWAEHCRWLIRVLVNPQYLLMIVVVDGQPVGQVRFDPVDSATCEVSIYLLPGNTGRGLGTRALEDGCREAFRILDVGAIHAWIRNDNDRSLAVFKKLGFQSAAPEPAQEDAELSLFILQRPREGVPSFSS